MKIGNYVITFNGEIYNYKEIKNILIKQGYHFKSTSDTEVLLLIATYTGGKILNEIKGMFAFAFGIQKNTNFFMARDYFGKKTCPFY